MELINIKDAKVANSNRLTGSLRVWRWNETDFSVDVDMRKKERSSVAWEVNNFDLLIAGDYEKRSEGEDNASIQTNS